MTHIPSLDSVNSVDWNFQHSHSSVFNIGNNITNDTAQLFPIENQSKLEARVRMINTELSSMGFPNMLLVEGGQMNVIVDVLVQNTLRLLDSHMKNLSVKSELDSRLQRVEGDLAQVQKMYRRCQENLAESQNAHAMAKERERRLEQEKKALNNKLKANTEEVRKLQLNIQRHETQAAHERRKLERENVALRERLSSSLSRSTYNANPRSRTNQQHRVTMIGSGLFGSLSSLNVDAEALEATTRRGGAQTGRRLVNSPSLTRVTGKLARRPTVSTSSITSSARSESKSARPWTMYDTAFSAASENGSQADLYALVVQQLQERQNTLLYENRELRDVVSQMASRLVRFTSFLERTKMQSNDQADVERLDITKLGDNVQLAGDGFDSLDEATDEDQPLSINRGSSDEDEVSPEDQQSRVSNGVCRRRPSARVNELLLQLPYALVREHLMQRVRQLSRRLWRQLRSIRAPAGSCSPHSPVLNGDSHPDGNTKTNPGTNSPTTSSELDRTTNGSAAPESPEAELAHLRSLVSKYKSRIQEQDVALRHALFSSSRRWTGLGFSDSFEHDPDADQSRRRSSLFKLNNGPFALPRAKSSETTSSTSALPGDGAGDRVPSAPNASPTDVNGSKKDVRVEFIRDFKSQHRSITEDRVIEIQHVVRKKQSGYSSDTPNITSANTSFTSSPFPGRTRALSIVDD
ncbi:hypothetical protein FGIG_09685 [Fasciola gigantica]|uniref:Afadin-and alpha-actinin-binding protein n=1 Tax=Fasciola gigantica TaxID=46835 RepID=A0A504YG15_FASGI|nr:hypothetical protein FGIG_09685 [Fasciola gigantica]